LSETPIFAEEEENREDCSLQPLFPGAWQDLQGMVRVTAISQTLVDPMEVEITVPSPRGFLYYDFHIEPLRDSDGDGVPDLQDRCSNTPTGAVVNADGCSIDQLVPCTGSGAAWKNHGEYVRAMSDAVAEFVRQNRITESEGQQIVAA